MTRSLLVVEDDGLIRMDLADTLTDLGFEVAEAGNADEALIALGKNGQFAALLTDIDMPGSMNGIALAHYVASSYSDCQIMVISGRYHPAQGSLPQGAQFLLKPISQKALLEALGVAGLKP
ncbi:response regulator [Rhizobium sp. NPDC090275]|uniref:response regulator n=1 Tax=Rhizobium sp. NPDC090275 TaxID=3364498 RepID=UPI00383BE2BE